jgi:hypothetical protein
MNPAGPETKNDNAGNGLAVIYPIDQTKKKRRFFTSPKVMSQYNMVMSSMGYWTRNECWWGPAANYPTDQPTKQQQWVVARLPESWERKIWSWVPQDPEPKMNELAKASSSLPKTETRNQEQFTRPNQTSHCCGYLSLQWGLWWQSIENPNKKDQTIKRFEYMWTIIIICEYDESVSDPFLNLNLMCSNYHMAVLYIWGSLRTGWWGM